MVGGRDLVASRDRSTVGSFDGQINSLVAIRLQSISHSLALFAIQSHAMKPSLDLIFRSWVRRIETLGGCCRVTVNLRQDQLGAYGFTVQASPLSSEFY